jgi:hypothetical protein
MFGVFNKRLRDVDAAWFDGVVAWCKTIGGERAYSVAMKQWLVFLVNEEIKRV